MGVQEETFRLVNEVKGRNDVYDLADTYEILTSDLETARKAMQRLDDETSPVGHALEDLAGKSRSAADSQRTLASASRDASTAHKGLETSSVNTGQAAVKFGWILEDIALGKTKAMARALEGMMGALAMTPGGLGGIFMLATMAVNTLSHAFPELEEKFDNFLSGGLNSANKKIPEATDNLKRMEERIQSNAKAIDGFKEKQLLTNTELSHYNGLIKEQAALEAAVTKEKEHRAEVEKLLKSTTEEQQTRASGFTKAIEGQAKEVQAGLEHALAAESKFQVEREAKRVEEDIAKFLASGASWEQYQAYRTQQERQFMDYRRAQEGPKTDEAQDLMAKAAQGDARALVRIRELSEGGYGAGVATGNVLKTYDANTPEAKAKAAKEAALAEEDEKSRIAAEDRAIAEEAKQAEEDAAEEEEKDRNVQQAMTERHEREEQQKLEREQRERSMNASIKAFQERQKADKRKALNAQELMEEAAANQIEQSTGATHEAAMGIAKRSQELQNANVAPMVAMQQAMAEMQAAMTRDFQTAEILRQRAEWLLQNARGLNAGQQQQMRSNQNVGPN